MPCVQGSERGSVNVLVYDSAGEGDHAILYHSLHYHNVSVRVGSLASRQGQPYRGYQDRTPWLHRELSNTDASQVVMHVDARDTLCLCNRDELRSKYTALAQGRNTVVVAAEPFLWPDEGSAHAAYRGKSLLSAYGTISNSSAASATSKMTYINTGLLAARPRALMHFFECVRRIFPQFPDACPREIAPRTGAIVTSYSEHARYNFTKNWWHGPLQMKGWWGWDQACFHMYHMEQVSGRLPGWCPSLVLDTQAELMLSMGKQARQLQWHNEKLRVQYKPTGAWPCFMHAGGPYKHLLSKLKRWWTRNAQSEHQRLQTRLLKAKVECIMKSKSDATGC